jgi:predicted transcriptional regulator
MPKTAPIRVSASLRRELNRVCKASGRSPTKLVEDAVRRAVDLAEYERVMKLLRAEMRRRGYARLAEEEIGRILS